MTELLGMPVEALAEEMRSLGQPAFRAKQVYGWLNRGARFEEMTNLSLPLREALRSKYVDQPTALLTHRESKLDGTCKMLFSFRDGNCVEGVLMRYHHGTTLCLSTQVGCRMGCAFCASTLQGCVRNLTAGEMLGEVLCAGQLLRPGERISNLVLMGSGEPLDNYDQVVGFLRRVSDPEGIGIGVRHISLSTCGLVDQMLRFAEENIPLTLSVSLHAPNDAVRRQLMPIARKWSVEEVLSACRVYVQKTGRRVILEYALVEGVNASPEHARELASRLRGLQCHVNVIPLNTVEERNLQGASEKTIVRFLDTLKACHISATRRREMGDDIEGACGQLRRHYLEKPGEETEGW